MRSQAWCVEGGPQGVLVGGVGQDDGGLDAAQALRALDVAVLDEIGVGHDAHAGARAGDAVELLQDAGAEAVPAQHQRAHGLGLDRRGTRRLGDHGGAGGASEKRSSSSAMATRCAPCGTTACDGGFSSTRPSGWRSPMIVASAKASRASATVRPSRPGSAWK